MMKSYDNLMKNFPNFKGSNVFCNICGYQFSKFDNVNINFPREGRCPLCGSLERHRHLFIYLLSIYQFLKFKKVLHFAPEAVIKNFLSSKCLYYDADIDPKKATYQVDITNICFENNFFDYIICIHVLEHIVNDIQAMCELFRVMKYGATAFISVPINNNLVEDYSITDPNQRIKFFGQEDHVRKYDLITLISRLNSVGFNTDMVSFPDNFSNNRCKFGDIIVLARKL